MTAAIGTLGKMGIGSSSPVSYRLDFKSENFRKLTDQINANGVRGTRSHHAARIRAGQNHVEGPVSFEPQAADLHQLLPWILCGTTTTVSGTLKKYKLGETAVARYVTIDRHAKVFTYATVGVDKATFKAEQGQPLGVDLDLVGATETVGNAGTFPNLQDDTTTAPFILADCTLSVNSTSAQGKNVEISVNNMIDKDRFFFSNTLTALVMLDREIRFKTSIPYGDYTALYDTGAGTGVAVVVTLTNGTYVLTFTMPSVAFVPTSPVVPGRVEVMVELEGRAYRTGDLTDDTGLELTATLDTGA